MYKYQVDVAGWEENYGEKTPPKETFEESLRTYKKDFTVNITIINQIPALVHAVNASMDCISLQFAIISAFCNVNTATNES